MTRYTTLGICTNLAGHDHKAGALFYRARYYTRQASAEKNGKKWYVISRTDLRTEIDLTLKQYNTALSKLKKLGLVETCQIRWGGNPITAIRVTEAGMTAIAGFTGTPKKEQSIVPSKGTHDCALPGHTHIKEQDLKNKTKGEDTASFVAGQTPETDHKSFSGKGKPELKLIAGGLDEGTTEGSMNAKDFILQAQAKPRPVPKNTKEALRHAWQDGVSKHHHTFVPPLTMMQLGQLGHIEKRTPPGRSVEILSWAVEHWQMFRKLTESEAGAFNTPEAPQIGFLLKHVETAVKGEALFASAPKITSKVKIGGGA